MITCYTVSEQAEYSSVVICVPSRGDDQSREMQSEGGPYVSTINCNSLSDVLLTTSLYVHDYS